MDLVRDNKHKRKVSLSSSSRNKKAKEETSSSSSLRVNPSSFLIKKTKEGPSRFNSSKCRGKKKKKTLVSKWSEYSRYRMILTVGDGDLSFSCSMAREIQKGSQITATTYDDHDTLLRKYENAENNINTLKDLGARVFHEVDATCMNNNPKVCDVSYDLILYNFPHAGFQKRGGGGKGDSNGGISRRNATVKHKRLVKGFFENTIAMLKEGGEVQVTHKDSEKYDKWDIVKLAKDSGLILTKRENFNINEYPGYINKYGDGEGPDEAFITGRCSKFTFGKKN